MQNCIVLRQKRIKKEQDTESCSLYFYFGNAITVTNSFCFSSYRQVYSPSYFFDVRLIIFVPSPCDFLSAFVVFKVMFLLSGNRSHEFIQVKTVMPIAIFIDKSIRLSVERDAASTALSNKFDRSEIKSVSFIKARFAVRIFVVNNIF